MNIIKATLKNRQMIFAISIVLNIYLLTGSGFHWPSFSGLHKRILKVDTKSNTTWDDVLWASNHTNLVACNNSNYWDDRSQMPIVFVGGFPRSGTTLMRTILDVHPNVR